MSRYPLLSSAMALVFGASAALGAEDHSAHQHQQPPPAADHAQHEQGTEHADHAQHARPASDEPTESELRHVPPPPPEHPMHDMTHRQMIELMQMDDAGTFSKVSFDELEWREGEAALAWDAQAWYGDDYDKLRLETEGERIDGDYEGRAELLWDHILDRWWNVQAGARHDFGAGPARSWLGLGVQGLAPYWFEIEATAYVGEEGRTAARFSAEYEVLITQRLILQPEVELNLYGKDDARNGIGSGLSDTEVALRLRYELRREVAPYVGLSWTRLYGGSADLAREAGHDREELQFVAGLRIWF
jgi:copper resistance protein B